MRQILGLEDLPPKCGDLFALIAVFLDVRDLGQQVVAAHADGPADCLIGDIDAVVLHRPLERPGVLVVAVHESSVHIEDDALYFVGHACFSSCPRPGSAGSY
jgi:hypothetical protein